MPFSVTALEAPEGETLEISPNTDEHDALIVARNAANERGCEVVVENLDSGDSRSFLPEEGFEPTAVIPGKANEVAQAAKKKTAEERLGDNNPVQPAKAPKEKAPSPAPPSQGTRSEGQPNTLGRPSAESQYRSTRGETSSSKKK